MVRTQIQLTEVQYEALRSRAAAEGRSMADLIRASVDTLLREPGRVTGDERRRRALAAIGCCRSGPADLSAQHDRHLAEALE
jgi:hypothetical protein